LVVGSSVSSRCEEPERWRWPMEDGMEIEATVKLTLWRWLQRAQRTGYRIKRICGMSPTRRRERRKLWPTQN